MGCVKVTLTPVGCISCRVYAVGGIGANASPVGGISARVERIGGMDASATRVGGIFCRVFRTCSPNIRGPYLEINPTVVWILAGQTQNDVFSNTFWNIH